MREWLRVRGGVAAGEGEGDDYFSTPSYNWPRPLPALAAYWDFLDWGHQPPEDEPGSAFMWYSFRIVHRMFRAWEGYVHDWDRNDAQLARQAEKGGTLALEARAIMSVKPPKPKEQASGTGSGRTGLSAKELP